MKTVALIMAGGQGKRFWPVSRKNKPKQFLSLAGDDMSMLQRTAARVSAVAAAEDIYIITNEEYVHYVYEQLSYIPRENVLCEPVGRNTAPCIGFAAIKIIKKYNDAVMVVLPSDHVIRCEEIFHDILHNAIKAATAKEYLITIGVRPNYPETGYGYINYHDDCDEFGTYSVKSFVEKPDKERAMQFVRSKDYLWNSGMFVWKASTIIGEYEKYAAALLKQLRLYADGFPDGNRAVFAAINPVSVDKAILEKSQIIRTAIGDFGWDDAGSFSALGRIGITDCNNNYIEGNVIADNCKNCVVKASDRLVAVSGMQDVVIVDTRDALLVCKNDSSGSIQAITEKLSQNDMEKYL